jgi:hypothetical protein
MLPGSLPGFLRVINTTHGSAVLQCCKLCFLPIFAELRAEGKGSPVGGSDHARAWDLITAPSVAARELATLKPAVLAQCRDSGSGTVATGQRLDVAVLS